MSKYKKLDNNALNNMTEFLKRHFSVSEGDKLSCVECRSLAGKILSFLPTIDIVHCGECKHRPICYLWKNLLNDNGYCSYGERIEE